MGQLDEKIANPSKVFDDPMDVLQDPALTLDEKRKILVSWKLEETRLADSEDENMSGGEADRLREVTLALLELNKIDGNGGRLGA
jgi:hypothetical protein